MLRQLLASCTAHSWTVSSLAIVARLDDNTSPQQAGADQPLVTVGLSLSGRQVADAATSLGAIEGVVRISLDASEDDD